jgi:hypothetical protein
MIIWKKVSFFTAPHPPVTSEGWLVEVSVPRLHYDFPRRFLYAVAIDDEHEAARAVRKIVGGLHCFIAPKCRLAARALTQLGVRQGEACPLQE